MADVFISYASEDRDRVRPLAEALIARGLSVWWDRALAAGDDDTQVIERELHAARAVVVVWTTASVGSTFVRDEAGRARDQGRLAPVLFDRGLQLPLGFGAFQAEDFTAWNGAPSAPQIALLEESLRARIEGRTVDGAAVQARRKRAMSRIRFVSLLGLVATVLVIAASVAVLTRQVPSTAPAVSARQDPAAQLLDLVAQGKITGDQALQLAKLLQADAFKDTAGSTPTVEAPADAPLVPPANASSAERAAFAEAPAVRRSDMISAARSSFEDAAAALLLDPDPRVRDAVLKTRSADTREEGVNALWALAKEGGASASAQWRACGALMLAAGDPRAGEALEQARALNPQDKNLWRLLSYAYARDNKPREAAGAALISEGIERAGGSDWQGAEARLDMALTLVRDPQAKGFVLSQIGDAAAAQEDWAGAEKRYRSALQMHDAQNNTAAISLDSSRLARALAKQGDNRRACLTLRRARAQGASVTDEELAEACAAPATSPDAPSSERP